jgi:hypothetical protein
LVKNDDDYDRKRVLQGFKGKPKSFYGYMRNLQTVKERVTVLKRDDGELTASDQEAADILGQYFEDMYTKEGNSEVPTVATKDLIVEWRDDEVDFSVDAVRRKLQKLATDKSPGPDGIHPMLLKECASTVAEPLSIIFKNSFESGTLPSDWKTAQVAPIFKKGAKTDRANYRPVSLTSVPCKVMESMIKEKILAFLEKTVQSRTHNMDLCLEDHV